MPTPTPEKLGWYRPLKALTADGQDSPQRACGTGSGVAALVCAALTQAEDYWIGAIGRFDLDTPTVVLRGIWFHVADFEAATDTLSLHRALPVAPATGGSPDTFRLYLGGNWRSSQEIANLLHTNPLDITGVVIDAVAALNGEGVGLLAYDATAQTLTWQAPGDNDPGAGVAVSGDGTYVLFSDTTEAWITVTVTAASLPAGDATDEIALRADEESLLPDWEGPETAAAPKTRYHLLVVKNNDGAAIADAKAWLKASTPDAAVTTLVDGMGTTAAAGRVSSADGWPTRSFWVYNADRDDVRYVRFRTGRTLYSAASGAGLRGFTAETWLVGDAVLVYPEIDIGLDAPATGQFEDPADEETAPGGMTFSAPQSYASGLAIGSLAAGATYGIWVRETILAGHVSREGYDSQVVVEWTGGARSGVLARRSAWNQAAYLVYYRLVGAASWTYVGLLDAAASPLQIALPTLADGDYEVKIAVQGRHWDPFDCLLRKRFTLESGVLVSPIPAVSGLGYAYGPTQTKITWLYRRQADAEDPDSFGVWQSATTPVDTSGDPAVAVPCDGVHQYQVWISHAGDVYVAVAAIEGSARGPSREILVATLASDPEPPDDQYAEC